MGATDAGQTEVVMRTDYWRILRRQRTVFDVDRLADPPVVWENEHTLRVGRRVVDVSDWSDAEAGGAARARPIGAGPGRAAPRPPASRTRSAQNFLNSPPAVPHCGHSCGASPITVWPHTGHTCTGAAPRSFLPSTPLSVLS
jgi:hypothetical protein